MSARRLTAVAIGAIVGSVLRWAMVRTTGLAVEPAIVVVNTVAAGVLGWLRAAVANGSVRRRDVEEFVGAGVCGALSTWSALAVRLADLVLAGDWGPALAWTAASLVLGIGAAMLTWRLTIREVAA